MKCGEIILADASFDIYPPGPHHAPIGILWKPKLIV